MCSKIVRQTGLDLVRFFAILFVIGAHYFLNTNYNSSNYYGFDMFTLCAWQTLTLINVPLFLTLTGYLNLNKKISRRYYRGGLRVVLTYLIIAIITIFFRIFILGEEMTSTQWILKITDFSVIPYGWYIEMWIGLFLLTPFLNVLWHNFTSRSIHRLLIFTLYLLTALPDFFNRYGVKLVPGYWESLYPITFFYIGAYIKTYQPRINKRKLWVGIIGLCMINPVLNLLMANGRPTLHLVGDGNGIIGMPLAAMFFMAIYDVKITIPFMQKLLKRISLLSLDMYLLSWMFDRMVYPELTAALGLEGNWLLIWLVCIPAVFILSYASANLTYPLIRGLSDICLTKKKEAPVY